uniref:DDRGK domain containing 1 n=2 Tax=Astyanax mexicanus TaxID=7994 RepID=W5KKI5_ASTMX
MDVALYLIAAAILVVLIIFAVKVRGRTEEADHEDHQNVAVRVAAPPRVAEERGAGMPRRRRGLDRMMAQRRAQREAPEPENIGAEVGEDEEDERPQAEERSQAAGKVGAKKQRKLEEKQARRAQREVRKYTYFSEFSEVLVPISLMLM